MAQIILHAQDNEEKTQQVNTTTLALKSIVAHEKKAFNELTGIENNLQAIQDVTLVVIKKLTQVMINLGKTCDILIGLQAAIWLSDNRYNIMQSYLNNYQTYYDRIPDSFFENRGGRL